jgi:hypothetical protein
MGDLTEISTPADLSPYRQIIRITNQILQPWLLINMYTPSHENDLPLNPTIQDTINVKVLKIRKLYPNTNNYTKKNPKKEQ